MENRKPIVLGEGSEKVISLYDDEMENKYNAQVIAPIITEGDAIGAVLIISDRSWNKIWKFRIKIGRDCSIFPRETNGTIDLLGYKVYITMQVETFLQ